jgi:hypothetical protein
MAERMTTPARFTGCLSAARFVRGIRRRHEARGTARAPLERFVRRSAATLAFASHIHRHEYQLRLLFERHSHPTTRERTVLRSSLVVHTRVAPAAGLSALPRMAQVERIIARERRVESTATIQSLIERVVGDRRGERSGRHQAIARIVPAPSVPMIVRTAPPLPRLSEQGATTPPERPRAEPWSAFPTRARSVAASPAEPILLSPSQIGRLTEQVVNAIDRRFTAHRERHGRI